jgi:phosphatidylserine/phosphatidylglycerophosphate/cardiolipin synthase-like enzyme
MDALFSSLVGGERLLERIRTAIDAAAATAAGSTIDVQITTFSFTDRGIAESLRALAQAGSRATVRIIADWAQGSGDCGRQVASLAKSLPNVQVRYKRDQPYLWDAEAGRVRWSYRASRGLLHHKTLGIFIDGAPSILICGSLNWTSRAANSYENLLVVTPDDAESRSLMQRMEWEFEAMWRDGSVTLSPDEALSHYRRIISEYQSEPAKLPTAIVGLPLAEGVATPATDHASRPYQGENAESHDGDRVVVAFSSRCAHDAAAGDGYSARNRARRFVLQKPSGKLKPVPLTLTTLALDVIGRARPGDTLCVAMYGLSTRVPEYGALLEAARRGVRVRIVLDGSVGPLVREHLQLSRDRDGLPIEIRAARSRPMHQKYIVHSEADTVLTGTANLSRDATARHSEHRIAIRQAPALTAAFLADFDAMWSRLSP